MYVYIYIYEGGTDCCAAASHTRLPMRRTATCGIGSAVAAEAAAVLARFRMTANPELTWTPSVVQVRHIGYGVRDLTSTTSEWHVPHRVRTSFVEHQ